MDGGRLAYEEGDAALRHPTAQVEPGAHLVGPVQLGPGARIEAGATVVGPASVGEGSTVGRNALLARSAVWSGCRIGEGAVVHGCVLGNGAVVAAGRRLFNAVRPLPETPAPAAPFASRGPSAPAARRSAAYGAQLSGAVRTSYTAG